MSSILTVPVVVCGAQTMGKTDPTEKVDCAAGRENTSKPVVCAKTDAAFASAKRTNEEENMVAEIICWKINECEDIKIR